MKESGNGNRVQDTTKLKNFTRSELEQGGNGRSHHPEEILTFRCFLLRTSISGQ